MLDRSTADALAAATTELAAVEFDAQRGRIIAEAQATARDIVAEAERAAQDIVANAVKTKAEADRALDEAKKKAVCIQKRAQAALALAENIAEGRRLIDALAAKVEFRPDSNNNGYSRGPPFGPGQAS